jgi:hypothetical protein
MKINRKMAGILMLLVGIIFFLMHALAVTGSDLGGLPTFLGIGFVFVLFGILTIISCTFMGEPECEGEAP